MPFLEFYAAWPGPNQLAAKGGTNLSVLLHVTWMSLPFAFL